MIVFLLTTAIIGAVLLVMSIGVILSGRCLQGSCGGTDTLGPDAEPVQACPCGRHEAKLEQGSHPAGT